MLNTHAASCSMLKWESKNEAELQVFVLLLKMSFVFFCVLSVVYLNAFNLKSFCFGFFFFLELICFVF